MNENKKNKNSIFSLVVSILTLAAVTVGSTFAFFSTVIKPEKEIEVKSANFKLSASIKPLYNSMKIIPTEDDDIMKIFHFVSDSTGSSRNPAGKFAEALKKMIDTISAPPHDVTLNTIAVQEFMRLYETQHYPGLGFLKKLSMLHHVQIIDQYLK